MKRNCSSIIEKALCLTLCGVLCVSSFVAYSAVKLEGQQADNPNIVTIEGKTFDLSNANEAARYFEYIGDYSMFQEQNVKAAISDLNKKVKNADKSTQSAESVESTQFIIDNKILESLTSPDNGSQAEYPTASSTTTQDILSISSGVNHFAVVDSSNALYTWGENLRGQLGAKNGQASPNPAVVMQDVAFVDCGDDFTLAVTKGGELYAWGRNEFGQLGDGSTKDRAEPVKIMDGVKLAVGGSSHTLILGVDGKLWSCGSGKYGQLGLGKTADALKPKVVMAGVKSISAGGNCSFAIKSDGSLYAFGQNNYSQLGNEKTKNVLSPTKVMSDITQVETGGNHSFAKNTKGEVLAWGSNKYGQLGLGKTAEVVKKPAKVGKYASFSAGLAHSVFIEDGGTLYASGQCAKGQFVQFGVDMVNTPKQINTAKAAACGGDNILYYTKSGYLMSGQATEYWKLASGTCNDSKCSYNGDNMSVLTKFNSLTNSFGGTYPSWYGGAYLCPNNNLHVGVVEEKVTDPNRFAGQFYTYTAKYSYGYLLDLQNEIGEKMKEAEKYDVLISSIGVDDKENCVTVGLVVLSDKTKEAFKRYVSGDSAIKFEQSPYEETLEETLEEKI